jgi:hypothetical protein
MALSMERLFCTAARCQLWRNLRNQNDAYLMCGAHPSQARQSSPYHDKHHSLLLSALVFIHWSNVTLSFYFLRLGPLSPLFFFSHYFFIHFLSSYSISITNTSYHSFFLPLNFLETQLCCCEWVLYGWFCWHGGMLWFR